MDRRIGQRSLVNKLRGLAIPVVLAFFALSSVWVGVALGQTAQTLILDNRNNAWGSITQDAIYRNGGFNYNPASPQWSSGHWQDSGYVQITTHDDCAVGMCQKVQDRSNSNNDYWRKIIYRSTQIPVGQKAWILNATVFVESHNTVSGNHHGVRLHYTVGSDYGSTGYYSFSGLDEGENTIVNACVDIPVDDQTGSDYPDNVLIGRMAGTNIVDTGHYYVDEMTIHTIAVPCEDYVPPSGGGGGGEYTTTVPITGTCVATVNGSAVDLSANLLANPSFEETANGVIPDSWAFRSPLYAPELYIENDTEGAADGVAYLSQSVMPGNSINQDVFLPASPEFVIGVLVSNSKAFDGGWAIGLADQVVDGAGGVTSGYIADEGIIDFGGEVYSDTVFSVLLFDSLDSGLTNLDVAYMIPVSDTGGGYTIYCPAVEEHCAATNCTGTPTTTPPGGGYPTGTGANAQCRTCPTPASWLALGEWLAYGWCIVTSLFVCHLRVWIWEATNIILAFPAWVIAGVNTFNSLLGFVGGNGGWLATILELGIGTPYAIYNAGINFLVSMYAQLQLGMNLGSNTMMALLGLDRYFSFFFSVVEVVLSVALTARTILYAMFDYVQLALATLPVLQEAIASDPMPLEEFLGTYYEGEEAYTNTNVAVGTPSEATILMVIFWGMWLMDSILIDYHLWPLTWLAIAGIGFYTLYWLFKEWSSLFSSAQLD